MNDLAKQIPVLEGVRPDQIPFDKLFAANGPVILRGLVSDWSLVQAGKLSPDSAMDMLQSHSSGQPVGVYIAPPATKARFFYNDDCTGFNYQSKHTKLSEIFAQIRESKTNPDRYYYYMNSLTLDNCFPGLREHNDLVFDHELFSNNQPLSKVWVGTESIAAAHYDVPSNLACCVVGARRFTLFPPEQIHNLYPGPLEPTPGGQVYHHGGSERTRTSRAFRARVRPWMLQWLWIWSLVMPFIIPACGGIRLRRCRPLIL